MHLHKIHTNSHIKISCKNMLYKMIINKDLKEKKRTLKNH